MNTKKPLSCQDETTQMLNGEISQSATWVALNWVKIWAAFLQSALDILQCVP